jgi:GntR family transcriptional regulator
MSDITNTEGIPLYVKIRESIRQQIASGELERGQKLPSEDELAAQFGVSRMTVRQGTSDLIDEGLLYRRHGVGTFVTLPHIERDHSRLTNFFENSHRQRIHAKVSILEFEVNHATPKVAQALLLEPDEKVIHLKTLRQVDDVMVTLHDAYLPHQLFSDLIQEELHDFDVQHLWSKFEKNGYPVKWAVQKLEARMADQELAKVMQIRVGAPILFKERTVYAEDGTPVEYTYCYNRGDMYSLTVTLNR